MSRPTFVLVHGFNVRDGGNKSIDRLIPHLRGGVAQMDYGWVGLFGALFGNDDRARDLNNLCACIPGPVIPVGHSNGNAIIHRASLLDGCVFRHAIYLNPALDMDAEPGPSVRRVDVFHAPDDLACLAAGFIPGVLWGSMGRNGYEGDDPRFVNHAYDTVGYPNPVGHSGVFVHPTALGAAINRIAGETP